MTAPLSPEKAQARLLAASVLIRRAVARAQLRDWGDGAVDHVLISRLGMISDDLIAAAREYGAVPAVKTQAKPYPMVIVAWFATCAAVLWVAGLPDDPVTVALFVAGTALVGSLYQRVLRAVIDPKAAHTLADTPVPATEDVLADLRAELDALEESLPPQHADRVLPILERIEVWRGGALEHLRFRMPPERA